MAHQTRRLHPQISECICITFGMQKREEKDDTATQMASGDITLCPVRAAAAIVRRIRSYPGANNDTPISAIWKYDRIEHITSKQISNALQDAVSAIGEDVLHIAKHEIGTHSIRSGAAMAMFLGGCVFLIMMIGRWSSDAFLRYIRKQVEEFNHDVSRKMLLRMSTAHPQLHLANCLKPRSKTTQSSRQRRDTKQRRGGRGLTGKATCHDTISLIITNECLERLFYFIDPCNYENGGSISFRCRRSRAEGVLNNY